MVPAETNLDGFVESFSSKTYHGVGLPGVEVSLFLLFDSHGPDNGSQEGEAFCWVGGQALAKINLSYYLIASSA